MFAEAGFVGAEVALQQAATRPLQRDLEHVLLLPPAPWETDSVTANWVVRQSGGSVPYAPGPGGPCYADPAVARAPGRRGAAPVSCACARVA